MTLLSDLQNTITGAAERVGPSIVGLGRGWAAGSGVVVAPGRVATVAHALRRGEPTVTFSDGRRAEASIAGADPPVPSPAGRGAGASSAAAARAATPALPAAAPGAAPAPEPAEIRPAL